MQSGRSLPTMTYRMYAVGSSALKQFSTSRKCIVFLEQQEGACVSKSYVILIRLLKYYEIYEDFLTQHGPLKKVLRVAGVSTSGAVRGTQTRRRKPGHQID